ncbi:MAG: hypothetical protein Kow006_19650 [Gammaproteobacteria bacterium]
MTNVSGKLPLWIAAALLVMGAGAASYLYLQKHLPSAETPAIQLAGSTAGAPGSEPLPPFQIQDVNGSPQDITQWKGKVVVLNFWATWCPPCRRELPTFKALQDEYGERGVQFVGISLDRQELVRDYVKLEGLNYPQLADPSEALKLGQKLGNRMGALPFTVIVDRDGNIAERIFGEWSREEAESLFEKLL